MKDLTSMKELFENLIKSKSRDYTESMLSNILDSYFKSERDVGLFNFVYPIKDFPLDSLIRVLGVFIDHYNLMTVKECIEKHGIGVLFDCDGISYSYRCKGPDGSHLFLELGKDTSTTLDLDRPVRLVF